MSNVRNALNAVRYDWLGVRIGGPGATMRGLWPMLIVTMIVVFGCFFAIGRVFAHVSTPTENSAAPVKHAAIPGGLNGGSPVAGEVPNSISAPPPQRKTVPPGGTAVLRATAPSQVEGQGAETSVAPPEGTAGSQSFPAQSSAGAAGSSGSGSSGSSSGGSGGHAAPSGSFDSSE
jgi:hypothetical protein